MIDDGKLDLIKNALLSLNKIIFEATKEQSNSKTVQHWKGGIISTDAPEFREWLERATKENNPGRLTE